MSKQLWTFVALFVLAVPVALSLAGCQADEEAPPPASEEPEPRAAAAQSVPAPDGVVADRFELRWEIDGTDLLLSVDTDLPDKAQLSVSARRIYYEKGSDTAYSRDYLSVFEPVSQWRSARRISLDAEAWKADLRAFQDEMAPLGDGLAFEIDRIEPTVTIRAMLITNQSDPRFGGRGNPGLTGAAVIASGNSRVVEAETEIPYPLDGPAPSGGSSFVGHDGLNAGESYRISKATPLMPGRNLEEAAGGQMRSLAVGTVVAVDEVSSVRGTPWYRVTVSSGPQKGATGWINSVALVGQKIQRVGS